MDSLKADRESKRATESLLRRASAPEGSVEIAELLGADWGDSWGKPLTAGELLLIGRRAFEPLFCQPPLGPIPEHLQPHSSVHGCVAEYEEKLEELERWKASQLSLWLRDEVGKNWRVAGKMYQLHMKNEDSSGCEKFWFRVVGDWTE